MTRQKLLGGTAALALALVGLAGEAPAQRTKLTVYTALENDQLKPYKDALEADVKDVDIAWVRNSTGVVTARILAEKANPQADVIWGLAVSSIMLFEQQGMLEVYAPAGIEALKPQFRAAGNAPTWTGMDAWISVACVNTVEQAKAKAPMPASWLDLIKPEFKGQVVMPNPASSGTGYLTVAGWIKVMGESAAWSYMDKLHENIAVYTHSGSAPCVQAARGERMVGIGVDMRGASEKSKGAPIELVVPKEGAGWDMEATAIVKGTKNLAAAKKLVDWTVSRKANEMYGKYYAIVAAQGLSVAPPNYPPSAEKLMLDLDLKAMANDRERILAEWSKRYDGKSAPR